MDIHRHPFVQVVISRAAPVLLCVCVVAGCARLDDMDLGQDAVPVAARSGTLPPVELPPHEKAPQYVYAGAQYRDPFIPMDQGAVTFAQRDNITSGIDPATLFLKGVIRDGEQSIALLLDTAGNTYFVRDKKLVDMKGRVIPGIVGIMKDESIVIVTEDKVVREIPLYE